MTLRIMFSYMHDKLLHMKPPLALLLLGKGLGRLSPGTFHIRCHDCQGSKSWLYSCMNLKIRIKVLSSNIRSQPIIMQQELVAKSFPLLCREEESGTHVVGSLRPFALQSIDCHPGTRRAICKAKQPSTFKPESAHQTSSYPSCLAFWEGGKPSSMTMIAVSLFVRVTIPNRMCV